MDKLMIAIQYPNGDFAGSPAPVRTSNPNLAGTYDNEADAQRTAAYLGNGATVCRLRYVSGRGVVGVAS